MLAGMRTIGEGLIANWLSSDFGLDTLIGWLLAIGFAAISIAGWHGRQRAAKRPGMASWYFIIPAVAVAVVAIAAAGFGIGLRVSGKLPGDEASHPAEVATGHTNPYPQSILTSRYYSKQNKEQVSEILDAVSGALNGKARDLFEMAEAAINQSPWDRPGEDLTSMIDRLRKIGVVSLEFRQDLFNALYKAHPDYRVELNNLLFPAEPPTNFQIGAQNFTNALVVWSKHRDSLAGFYLLFFAGLAFSARFAVGGSRLEFLNWVSVSDS